MRSICENTVFFNFYSRNFGVFLSEQRYFRSFISNFFIPHNLPSKKSLPDAENINLPIYRGLYIGRLPFCNLNYKSITFLVCVPKNKTALNINPKQLYLSFFLNFLKSSSTKTILPSTHSLFSQSFDFLHFLYH